MAAGAGLDRRRGARAAGAAGPQHGRQLGRARPRAALTGPVARGDEATVAAPARRGRARRARAAAAVRRAGRRDRRRRRTRGGGA